MSECTIDPVEAGGNCGEGEHGEPGREIERALQGAFEPEERAALHGEHGDAGELLHAGAAAEKPRERRYHRYLDHATAHPREEGDERPVALVGFADDDFLDREAFDHVRQVGGPPEPLAGAVEKSDDVDPELGSPGEPLGEGRRLVPRPDDENAFEIESRPHERAVHRADREPDERGERDREHAVSDDDRPRIDADAAHVGGGHEDHEPEEDGPRDADELLLRRRLAAHAVEPEGEKGQEKDEVVEADEESVPADRVEIVREERLQERAGAVRREKSGVERGEIARDEHGGLESEAIAAEEIEDPVPFLVVPQEAQEMDDERLAEDGPRARALVRMNHDRFRNVEDLPAVLLHPVAPVEVLEIEEETLVHLPHPLERLAPHEHAGADDPVHLAGGVVGIVHEEMVAERLRPGEEPAENRPPVEERGHRVERARGILERAVRIDELGPRDPGVGVVRHERREPVDRPLADDDVGVEDENQASRRKADALVHAARVAAVLVVRRDPHAGEAPAHHLRGSVGGGVVDDDRLDGAPGGVPLERGEAALDGDAAVVGDDDDG